MRAALLALILAVPTAPLTAQQPSAIQPAQSQAQAESASARPVEAPVSAAPVALQPAALDSLRDLIADFRRDPQAAALPPNDQITMGGRTIAAGTEVAGPVAAAGGPIHVYGTVTGNVIAIGGDVIVHAGGRVTGDAIAALGTVTLDGGRVSGDMRQLGGSIGEIPRKATAAAPESRVGATRHALALACSWLVILVLIGIGVFVFANDYLDTVTESLEGRFGRSFWAGVAAQLALAPVLALLCIALAVTIIGALLIPFAVVAYILAVVGLLTLGFLAVARITGESVSPSASRGMHARGAMLRALVVGVVLYMSLWVIASAFAWAPMVQTILRGIAVAITWVAATAGFGAAVLTRGGKRRPQGTFAAAVPVNDLPWQTPTPVAGVVAARRPTPAHTSRER